ncbi:hypothetical protein ACSBR1_001403 [Camellia fascicularis]
MTAAVVVVMAVAVAVAVAAAMIELVYFLFTIPGYNKFKVDCDDDVRNMLLLAKLFGLDHIDALIQMQGNGLGSQCGVTVSHDDRECETMDLQTTDMEAWTDLLASYCPHRMKTFLSVGWAFNITHVGQFFWGGAHEFQMVLYKYAIECGLQFKYVKNDAGRVTAMCKFATSTGWRVCEQPLTCLTDVVFDMKDGYGLDISYRVAWLGVEKARSEVFGDHDMSLDQLRWYSDVVMENNPRSYINLDFDQQIGRLVRFKGTLLVAIAKDGNQGLFPIAFAIVDSEKSSNWEWFLRHLAEVVDGSRNLTFVSDCNVGLIQSMPIVFPAAHHAFCLLHLQMNLHD